MPPHLEARDLIFAYHHQPVINRVSLTLEPGEVVGLIGPNGSGKSTLLRLLLGLLPPAQGEVTLNSSPMQSLSRKAIARQLALVPQDTAIDFVFAVRDVVAMGRNPHLKRLQPETSTDAAAIQWALNATETDHLAHRPIHELSGGERQRVILARALAQQATTLLLDEPTANLDVTHQLETLMLVRNIAQDQRCALVALHDLALAARFCDRLLLLANGQLVAQGRPEEVLTTANLATYFRLRAKIQWDNDAGGLIVLPIAPSTSECGMGTTKKTI